MRTPNCHCIVCGKPMYRRPYELAKYRYVACVEHRVEAQNNAGRTEKQLWAFTLGREKGTNHRAGYKHKEESKQKISRANKKYWAEHPKEAIERGSKTRGNNHYQWKGGITILNKSIRQMTENRKWMDAIKERDGKCKICGTTLNLESHHSVSLEVLIRKFGIKNKEQARNCSALWDLSNGETLCQRHHYWIHGRRYENKQENLRQDAFTFTDIILQTT